MSEPVVVRDVGVPVRSVNWVRLFVGEDPRGAACLYATMGQHGRSMFITRIDVQTGACEQFHAPVEGAHHPTATFWSQRRKCLFVGVTPGYLLRFDPKAGEVENLGLINGEKAQFPCRIDEAPDGMLYVGSHGACDLTRYDPESGEFTRFGRMDDVDMCFYPLCGADGTIAGLVRVTGPHVVAFDPESGQRRAVGPTADKDAGVGHVELIKGADGLLYIRSHEGSFRVSGMEAAPVEAAPEPSPEPTLPDGSTFRFVSEGEQSLMFRKLAITSPAGNTRVIDLDWEGDGTAIFLVRRGPDDRLYGSTYLPLHLFSYDPAADELTDHGACSTAGGEVYSMGNLGGLLYACCYGQARLSVYDPSRPYRFGTDEQANPRELGRMDEVACRPRDMLCGPGGRVWVASIPDYGMWGGNTLLVRSADAGVWQPPAYHQGLQPHLAGPYPGC